MEVRFSTLFTIICMVLITYLTRAGGLWFMRHFRTTPRLDAAMRHMPGAVLTALIAPSILVQGSAEIAATVATIFVAAQTNNILFSMFAGVLVVLALRSLGL